MLNRWKTLRNEFLPGFTLKTMRGDGAKPKAKTGGGRGKGKAGKEYKCLVAPEPLLYISKKIAKEAKLTRHSLQLLRTTKLKVKTEER
jgi:hypothetical protein